MAEVRKRTRPAATPPEAPAEIPPVRVRKRVVDQAAPAPADFAPVPAPVEKARELPPRRNYEAHEALESAGTAGDLVAAGRYRHGGMIWYSQNFGASQHPSGDNMLGVLWPTNGVVHGWVVQLDGSLKYAGKHGGSVAQAKIVLLDPNMEVARRRSGMNKPGRGYRTMA